MPDAAWSIAADPAKPDDGGASRPVVFLFPGLSGRHKELEAFQAGCGSSLELISIAYPEWLDGREGETDLDIVVAHCIAQINPKAPTGPLLLAGYSFGGHMAFAVAAALAAAGRAVGGLGLLDTHADPPIGGKGRPSVLQHLRRFVDGARDGELAWQIAVSLARVLIRSGAGPPLTIFMRRRAARRRLRLETYVDQSLQMQFRLGLLRTLLARMQRSPVPLRVAAVLFRCVEQPAGVAEDLGWRPYLPRLRIVAIPGDHFGLIDAVSDPSALSASFATEMNRLWASSAAE